MADELMSALDAPKTSDVKKKLFGLLTTYVNFVKLESGASYTIPGVTQQDFETKDESAKEFKGKRKLASGNADTAIHVVLVLTRESKEGNAYQTTKDYLAKDKVWVKQIQPSFVKVVGAAVFAGMKANTGLGIFVALDEFETGETFAGRDGNTVSKSAWRASAVYASEAEMKKAADAYFAGITNDSAHASSSNGQSPSDPFTQVKDMADFHTALADAAKGKAPKAQDAALLAVALEWVGTDAAYNQAHLEDFKALAKLAG